MSYCKKYQHNTGQRISEEDLLAFVFSSDHVRCAALIRHDAATFTGENLSYKTKWSDIYFENVYLFFFFSSYSCDTDDACLASTATESGDWQNLTSQKVQ